MQLFLADPVNYEKVLQAGFEHHMGDAGHFFLGQISKSAAGTPGYESHAFGGAYQIQHGAALGIGATELARAYECGISTMTTQHRQQGGWTAVELVILPDQRLSFEGEHEMNLSSFTSIPGFNFNLN